MYVEKSKYFIAKSFYSLELVKKRKKLNSPDVNEEYRYDDKEVMVKIEGRMKLKPLLF